MVLTIVEHDDGDPDEKSLETLTLARDLAARTDTPVEAVAFEGPGDALADELGAYGVSTVHLVDHERLTAYAPKAWAESARQLVDDRDPEAVLAPGTERGHETLAHLASRLGEAMAANCTEVTAAGEAYELVRHRWGGTLIEEARLSGGTKLLSVAPNELPDDPADEPAEATLETFSPSLDDSDFRVQLERLEISDEEGVPLGEARVVVGGGRGVGSADGFEKLEELADLLGGTVGSSRAAVNEGWRPHDDQVGQTGTKISHDLYIACGISGAVQHMVGCKGSENIMAINTDPEAAIIQKADYAIIADLHEVVPAITDIVRREKGES